MYFVLIVKIVFRIVIFRKILDGDPTKITKMSQKIDLHAVLRKLFLPCTTLSWATAWGLLDNAYDQNNAYADVDPEGISQRLFFSNFTLQMFTK